MPTRTARELEKQPTGAPVEEDLHALVTLAERVTKHPAEIRPAEIATAAATAQSRGEFLDAVGVIIGFNFVTRVANALGVDPEIPSWLGRFEFARHLARSSTAMLLRWFVDLSPRQPGLRPVEENLNALGRRFGEIGIESLPECFRPLKEAPHLLEVQRELFEAHLKQIGPAGKIGMDLCAFMAAGLTTLDEIGAPLLRGQVAEWVQRHGTESPDCLLNGGQESPCGSAPLDVVVARFARDVTRRSYSITNERVEELRSLGLNDERILDLVCGIALWNACGRLEILLGGLPCSPEQALGPMSRSAQRQVAATR